MEKESKLGPLAMIIGSLTVILIAVITARDFFPVYFIYVVVTFLLVAISYLTIHGLLAPPICDFIKKRRERRKHDALARKYFDDFKHFTERFGEFVKPRRIDNIPYVLRDLNSSQEFRNISFLSPQDPYNLFNYFKERLKRFDRTKEDFSLIVNEFDSILDIYNEHSICKPIREIRAICREGRGKVAEGTKDDYKKAKGTYERFIGDYIVFGKKLNKEFGEKIFREYFEMPGEL